MVGQGSAPVSWNSPLQKEICAELASCWSWGQGDAVAAGYFVPHNGHGFSEDHPAEIQ